MKSKIKIAICWLIMKSCC